MLRLLNFVLVPAVLASAFALYTLEHNTRALERKIAKVESETESEYEMIGLLDAEWSLLTRPQRLERLARHHLNMGPLLPDQIKRPGDITGSLPPAPAAAPDETPASEDPLADLLRMMQ
jgi:cell division protein FtsL